MMDDEIRKSLIKGFLEEAGELLAELERSLLDLAEKPRDRDLVGRVFRALHTIKGNSSMFGFNRVSDFTHELEWVFSRVNRDKLAVTRELVDLSLQARDRIVEMIRLGTEGDQEPAAGDTALVNRVRALVREPGGGQEQEGELPVTPGAGESPVTYHVRFRPFPAFFSTGADPVALLRELSSMGPCRVTALIDDIPEIERLDPQSCVTGWDVILATSRDPQAIREVFLFAQGRCELSIDAIDREEAPDRPRKSKSGEDMLDSIRVGSSKLDELVNLVGELVTVQARLSSAVQGGGNADITYVAEEIERLTAQLRDNVFDIRMVPIGAFFARFRRLVHDLSHEMGKEVDLVTEGEKIELDKTIIARLGDPLMHMIRNSISHGIETSAGRRAAGKPPRGMVRLAAAQAGADIVIRLEDDGAGLDRDAIRRKARELGLIGTNDDPPDDLLFSFILRSGFTTAREVSSISGRGVGMDVVRKGIEDLKGSLALESRPGKGTTFTITLPRTLAIIQGLLVGVGEESYVIPLDDVQECVELLQGSATLKEGQIILLRGEVVPYLRLRDMFGVAGERPALEQVVVAVTSGGRKVGLAVDRVMGEQQTVVKGLGRMLRKTEGLTGATILGDGSPALILDVSRLAYLAGRGEEGVVRWTAES